VLADGDPALLPAHAQLHEVADGIRLAARAEAGQLRVVDDIAGLDGVDVGERDECRDAVAHVRCCSSGEYCGPSFRGIGHILEFSLATI